MANEVFINYRNGDQPGTATLIERDLSHRFGSERIFRASKSIPPSANFAEALRANLHNCQVLVAVVGKDWLLDTDIAVDLDAPESPDDWTQWEIREAFRCHKHVLPVLVGRTTEKLPASGVPDWVVRLAQCQYVRFDTRNADADLDQLADIISNLIPELDNHRPQTGSEPASGAPAPTPGTSNTASDVHGTVLQARDHVHQQTGGIGSIGTVVSHPVGPVHTGSGNQYNGPHPPATQDHPGRDDRA